MIIVRNRRNYSGPGEYVGRGTPLGNPHHPKVKGVGETLPDYLIWLRKNWKNEVVRKELLRLAEIAKHGNLILICWCHPAPCHANVIKEAIEKINASKEFKSIEEKDMITERYLIDNPNHIFVFGDNILRRGYGGAAKLRDMPNSYGFITKKAPNNNDESFYRPDDYKNVFEKEMIRLIAEIQSNPNNTYLISPVGSGLANRYQIWEKIIKSALTELGKFNNVRLLFDSKIK